MMGKMTLSYGVAQIIGPAIVGWLATRLGNYSIGLTIAAGVMVVGVMLLAILKLVEKRDATLAIQPGLLH
jgi:MFS family permease